MIVTRFAPSPTGYLHIGGARTALFNWLYAKKTGGKFLLRIEDTDLKRNTPTATEQVINDLKWLGISWDEGPQVGGENGPYFQSQRRDIYDKYILGLIEQGKAYYCFDTSEELDAMRADAEKNKTGFAYRRPEKFPTAAEVDKARSDGRDITVRFVMPDTGEIMVEDTVRGQIKFDARELGDFIILKSDGFPTYHFAVVVDDELMGVNHIIRGQEHLMNTPYHIALQDALGFSRPKYSHISVTVSENGGKLSKRESSKVLKEAIKKANITDYSQIAKAGNVSVDDIKDFMDSKSTPDVPILEAIAAFLNIRLPEVNVVDFFKSGYLPETMVNFTALLGWNSGNEKELMTVDELVECFDISRLSKSNSLFDRKKLIAFNTEHIRMCSNDKLLSHFEHYLKAINSPVLEADDEMLLKLIEVNHGARTLEDIEKKSRFLFVSDDQIEYDQKDLEKVLLKNDGEGLKMLAVLKDILASMKDITEEELEKALRQLAEEKGVGLGKVAQPLRVAISGCTISPPIFISIEMLSMQRTIKRIENTLNKFKI